MLLNKKKNKSASVTKLELVLVLTEGLRQQHRNETGQQ